MADKEAASTIIAGVIHVLLLLAFGVAGGWFAANGDYLRAIFWLILLLVFRGTK
jgi:hypothetical protein